MDGMRPRRKRLKRAQTEELYGWGWREAGVCCFFTTLILLTETLKEVQTVIVRFNFKFFLTNYKQIWFLLADLLMFPKLSVLKMCQSVSCVWKLPKNLGSIVWSWKLRHAEFIKVYNRNFSLGSTLPSSLDCSLMHKRYKPQTHCTMTTHPKEEKLFNPNTFHNKSFLVLVQSNFYWT